MEGLGDLYFARELKRIMETTAKKTVASEIMRQRLTKTTLAKVVTVDSVNMWLACYIGGDTTATIDVKYFGGDYQTDDVVYVQIVGNTYIAVGNMTRDSYAETDPLSLHLDQTTPQTIINGVPIFDNGLDAGSSVISNVANPIQPTDAVNLQTLEEAIPLGMEWYLSNTDSADVAGYKLLDVDNDPIQSGFAVDGTSSGQALEEWVTVAGSPGAILLKEGEITCHFYAKVAAAGTTDYLYQITAQFYQRTAAGVETQLGTDATTVSYLTASSALYSVRTHLVEPISMAAGDRIVVKLKTLRTGTPPRVNSQYVTLYIGDTTPSHMTIPTTLAILGNYLPLAGGTMSGDIDFAKFKAIAMCCDNGTTFPSTPNIGQWFLHTPTGRKWLYQYDGTAWKPIAGFGTSAIYVDYTDGTDSQDKGYGVDANAYKTIQYMATQLPPEFDGNITVTLSAETHTIASGYFLISGKRGVGGATISLVGAAWTTMTTFTSSSYSRGSGATHSTVTIAGTPWVADAYKGKMLYCTAGTGAGYYMVIASNTNNTLTLVGCTPIAFGATDSYAIYDWATIIPAYTFIDNQPATVSCSYIKFGNGNATPGLIVTNHSNVHTFYCSFQGGNGVAQWARWYAYCCHFYSAGYGYTQSVIGFAMFDGRYCYLRAGGNGDMIVWATRYGYYFNYHGCVYDGYVDGVNKANYGVYMEAVSIGYFNTSATYGNQIFRNLDTGLYATQGSQGMFTSGNTYEASVTTPETAVAASYAYID